MAAWWLPHLLTGEQKTARLIFAQDFIQRFGNDDHRNLKKIVTGDETWGFYFDPLTKQASMEWVTKDNPPESVGQGARRQQCT